MISSKVFGVAAFAACLWSSVALAAGAQPAEGRTEFAPIQSISYVFGSKSMSGYFVRVSDTCAVMLMISEKSDPDHVLATTPTRVRLLLNPDQTAGLDTQEGRSLNITCGADARTLLVDASSRAAAPSAPQAVQAGTADKPTIAE
jgi:hypothetical protein